MLYWFPYSSHTSHHPSRTPWLPWISYEAFHVFYPSLKQNFIAYRSSKMSDCIFEIHQLWESGFSRVYSHCYCSRWFEAEIIKIGQSSHMMYSNCILKFQESTTILNAHTKKVWKLIVCISYDLPRKIWTSKTQNDFRNFFYPRILKTQLFSQLNSLINHQFIAH